MDHETVTPHPGANTPWTVHLGEPCLSGLVTGGQPYTLWTVDIESVDRVRQLVKTKSGRVYHVPGPWPDDLDLPAMRAPVPLFVQVGELWCPELAAYLTEHGGGTWSNLVQCEDLLPGWILDATPWSLFVLIPDRIRIRHPTARDPRAIAEALRDLPTLRAWLLSELDAARAVVGGAS